MHLLKLGVVIKIFLFLLFGPFGFAQDLPLAKMILAEGPVLFDHHRLHNGDLIFKEGILETKKGARVKLVLEPSQTEVFLSGETQYQVQSHQLLQGQARWKIKKTPQFQVRTKNAVMGVRGTDFMGVFNPVFEETEIVVFEGVVQFQSQIDSSDLKTVNQGYWGGIGGRFGKKIGELIRLPQDALGQFEKAWH